MQSEDVRLWFLQSVSEAGFDPAGDTRQNRGVDDDRIRVQVHAAQQNVGSAVNSLAANIKKGNPGTADASAHTRGEAADIRVSGMTKATLYEQIVAMHKAGELPWLTYVYKISGSGNNVHVGVDNFKKRATPYGGNG